ncbi:FkbM family methyltransferase [Fibrella arboris]|uniref:FkbM family methyltransferase n=1 Tax=Fibrella arboris TaxID=3242486 RepID=UPI00352231F0
MIRSLIEKLSRRVVFKRRLPSSFGGRSLYVTPEGGLRYWKPTLQYTDDGFFRLIETFVRPGDTVWDIGANLGLFLFAAAHKTGPSGQCLAIEPDVWLASLLQRSIQLNSDLNIDVLPFALSDQVGLARFNIAQRARTTNYLDVVKGSTQTGGIRHSVLVPVSTVDTLLTQYGKPDLVKIDVETAEHLVLKGSVTLLSKVRPAIYCEVADENAKEVQALLLQHNYRLLDGDKSSFPFAERPVCNTLALPAEHWFLKQR